MAGMEVLKPFEMDIDELLDEFSQCGSPSFSAFKKVWLSRKFSYIYEGRPACNPATFMQSLYSHCIAKMIGPSTLSRRLGALYCLYSLHEIQPFKPSFKIYISLGELKLLRQLVVDSKAEGVTVAVALVNRMLQRQSFLFGAVGGVGGGLLKQKVDEVKGLHYRLVETAYDKLLACSRVEECLQIDLGREMELDRLKKMSGDYTRAKELAIAEAAKVVEVGEVKGMAERGDEAGTKMEELVQRWNAGKEEFTQTTGSGLANEDVAADEFGAELEQLLTED